MVGEVDEVAAGAHLDHDVSRAEHAGGDGLRPGVPRAHQHRGALGKAGLGRRLCRHRAGDVGGVHHPGQLVRPAVEAAVLLVHRVALQVIERREILGQIAVDGVLPRQLGAEVGGAGEKLGRFGVDLGQVVLHPQNFRGDVRGAELVAVEPLGLFPAVIVIEPFDLLVAAAVHPVEDGIAQRRALGVHRDAVAPQCREAHTAHVGGGHAALPQQLAGDGAEIAPPGALRVMLKKAGPGIQQLVPAAGESHDGTGLVDEHAFGLVGAHVDAHKVFHHASPRIAFTASMNSLTRCSSTRFSNTPSFLKVVPTKAPSQF